MKYRRVIWSVRYQFTCALARSIFTVWSTRERNIQWTRSPWVTRRTTLWKFLFQCEARQNKYTRLKTEKASKKKENCLLRWESKQFSSQTETSMNRETDNIPKKNPIPQNKHKKGIRCTRSSSHRETLQPPLKLFLQKRGTAKFHSHADTQDGGNLPSRAC